jgi:hypothetical protein
MMVTPGRHSQQFFIRRPLQLQQRSRLVHSHTQSLANARSMSACASKMCAHCDCVPAAVSVKRVTA